MAQQTINTIIVLRNDQTTNWESSSVVMLKGEVGIGYLENGNVNVVDERGKSLLDYAIQFHNNDIFELLLKLEY